MGDSTDKSNDDNNNSIRLVVQRYRKASLLIDEKTVVTVGDSDGDGGGTGDASASSLALIGSASRTSRSNHIGMLVYVSFSKRAIPPEVQKAARTILNLPIQTEGAWGDGSKTQSILQVAVEASKRRQSDRTKANQGGSACLSNPVSILLVPQANLIAKVKKNGKSVQYRDQIDKVNGETLYNLFVESVEELLLEEYKQMKRQQQQHEQGGSGEKNQTTSNKSNNTTKTSIDPSVLPKEYFQCLDAQQENPMYGSFDPTTGLPLTAADGGPLTKSASKRIRKLYDAHVKRHEKYLASKPKSQPNQFDPEPSKQSQPNDNGGGDTNDTTHTSLQAESTAKERLDPSFVKLVAGSFGKRQGLELVSDMGPFCHVIDI